MRHWQVREHSHPSQAMFLADAPVPERGPDEVLIQVRTVGLNYPDALYCTGEYQEKPPLPFTPGLETCGHIAEASPRSGFRTGQRVVAFTVPPRGSFAEFATARAEDVFAIPDELDETAAVAMFGTYQTAHLGLHRRASITPDDSLMILGASGGVGSAAIAVGKATGAKIIAVTSGSDKVDHCQNLGADVVLDRSDTDITEAVREHTNGRGVDIVFDPVGGDAFTTVQRCLAFEGRYVVVGFTSGSTPSIAAGYILVKNISVLGLHTSLYRDQAREVIAAAHTDLIDYWRQARIKSAIAQLVPFEEIPAALDGLLDRSRWGKMVARVS